MRDLGDAVLRGDDTARPHPRDRGGVRRRSCGRHHRQRAHGSDDPSLRDGASTGTIGLRGGGVVRRLRRTTADRRLRRDDLGREETMTPDLSALRWDANGLIPAIVQQHDTREVLMVAWMNEESLRKTLDTSETWFWSRSRKELWHKGATSGNT